MAVKITTRPNGPYLIEGECELYGGPAQDRALPLRRVEQQADVRRHAQQSRLPGVGGSEEVAFALLGLGVYSGWASGSTSVSSTQSSGGSGAGRVLAAEVTVRPRLGENHSHIPAGAPLSCASPSSGPVVPDSSRALFRWRLASCLAF